MSKSTVAPQIPHAPSDDEATPPVLEEKFNTLVAEWRRSVRPSTRLKDLVSHPAYNEIITMGRVQPRPVLRLILEQLKQKPYHWFLALAQISGVDAAEGEESFQGCVDAWLKWGTEQGIIGHDGRGSP
jgi:hypothetical protein